MIPVSAANCFTLSLRQLSGFDVIDVAARYLAWQRHAFDIGGQTSSALDAIERGTSPREAGRDVWEAGGRNAAGNGSLARRRISPHTRRHTTAMHLLQAGVDLSSIALWLGHANPGTTHAYVEADLAIKERTLQKIAPPTTRSRRFRATDRILTVLDRL